MLRSTFPSPQVDVSTATPLCFWLLWTRIKVQRGLLGRGLYLRHYLQLVEGNSCRGDVYLVLMARYSSCSNDKLRWGPDDRIAKATPSALGESWRNGMALTEPLCYCPVDNHHQCLDNLHDDRTAKATPSALGVPWRIRMAKAR